VLNSIYYYFTFFSEGLPQTWDILTQKELQTKQIQKELRNVQKLTRHKLKRLFT